jgi:hypothetical protein
MIKCQLQYCTVADEIRHIAETTAGGLEKPSKLPKKIKISSKTNFFAMEFLKRIK